MTLRNWLAILFALLMIAGCTEAATGTGHVAYPPHSPDANMEYPRDRGGDGGGGGGGGGM